MLVSIILQLCSSVVIVLGIGLIVLCTLIIARDVVPVVSEPGGTCYHILRVLLSCCSFQILFNYVCSTAFSARLGSAPAIKHGGETLSARATVASVPDVYGSSDYTCDADFTSTHVRPVYSAAGHSHTSSSSSPTDADGAESAAAAAQIDRVGEDKHRFGRRTGLLASLLQRCLRRGICLAVLAHTLRRLASVSSRTASPATLCELERLAEAAEEDCALGKFYRVLDRPRRYCHTCRRLKAPREHHCSICNTCVPKMDHHCPWINNCVDAENEPHFVLLVYWLWLGTVLSMCVMGYAFASQTRHEARVRDYDYYVSTMYDRTVDELNANGALYTHLSHGWGRLSHMAPFGIHGDRINSFAVTLVFTCVTCIGCCMTYFVYAVTVHTRYNITPIEEIILFQRSSAAAEPAHGALEEEKREWYNAYQTAHGVGGGGGGGVRAVCCGRRGRVCFALLKMCCRFVYCLTKQCLTGAACKDGWCSGQAHVTNPYNLGTWGNILSVLGRPKDPVVQRAWRRVLLPAMYHHPSHSIHHGHGSKDNTYISSCDGHGSSDNDAHNSCSRRSGRTRMSHDVSEVTAVVISSSGSTALSSASPAVSEWVSAAEAEAAPASRKTRRRLLHVRTWWTRVRSPAIETMRRWWQMVQRMCRRHNVSAAWRVRTTTVTDRLRACRAVWPSLAGWRDGATLAWLLIVPSLQPRDSDGMHYPIWDDFLHGRTHMWMINANVD